MSFAYAEEVATPVTMNKRRWLAMTIVVVLAGCSGLGYRFSLPRVSAEQLRQEVQEHLAIGTARADVEAWLRSRNMAYSSISQHGIMVVLENTGPLLSLGDYEIQMYFDFDEQGRLTRSSVDEFDYFL